jgi:hypothetical protein
VGKARPSLQDLVVFCGFTREARIALNAGSARGGLAAALWSFYILAPRTGARFLAGGVGPLISAGNPKKDCATTVAQERLWARRNPVIVVEAALEGVACTSPKAFIR